MGTSGSRAGVLLTGVLLVVGCSGGGTKRSDSASTIVVRDVAIARASTILGSPTAEIHVMASAVQRLPETGVTLHRYTFQSRTTGQLALVDLDDRGQEVDERAWVEAERVARIARHGRMDGALENAIMRMSQGERRWVVVHVPVEESFAGAGRHPLRHPEAARAEEARVTPLLREGVRRILAMLPPDTRYEWPGGTSPFLSVRLSASEIRMLSRSNDVGNLYDGSGPPAVPQDCSFDEADGGSVEEDPYNQYAVTNALTRWVSRPRVRPKKMTIDGRRGLTIGRQGSCGRSAS